MVIEYYLAMTLCLNTDKNACVVKEFGPYNSPNSCMIDGESSASRFVEVNEKGYILIGWKCTNGKDT